MVDPKRLLRELAANEIALPELLVMLPSLLQRGDFSAQQLASALDEAVEQTWLERDLAERISERIPRWVRVIEAEGNGPAPDELDEDDAVTLIAYPDDAVSIEPEDDDQMTVIAYPEAPPNADLPDDDQLTVMAYPEAPPNADLPDDDELTILAHPQDAVDSDDDDEDEAPTIIARPPSDDEDEDSDATVINTESPSTSAFSQTHRPPQTSSTSRTGTLTNSTTEHTSQRSWDLPGATNPQLQKLGPGSIIKERFILDKVLGAGGMGKVFQARDLLKVEANDSNPYVAMKVLTEDFKAHPQAFIALQREASRQQKLAHPNIATVYDFDRIGMTGTQVFITMELLVGKPLDTFIRKVVRPRGGLPFDEAFPIIQQLGASLSYAHQRNIVHSDFKPGNAFLCDDGTVKTLDFGIARAVNAGGTSDDKKAESDTDDFDAGSLGALTPAYASLEMLQGKDPATQDDLYALACVAYELLTGYHPFNKKSAAKALEANLLPGPVKGLKKRQMRGLLRGLAFEKDKRTATVEEFLEELEGKANWHKNPWVLGSAFSVVLAIAAYNPVVNYLDERRIQMLIEDVLTAEPVVLENTISLLPQLDLTAQNRITDNGREVFQRYFQNLVDQAVNLEAERYNFDQAVRELARMERLYPDSVALNTQRNQLELQRNRYLHLLSQQLNLALANEWLLPSAEENNGAGQSISGVLERVAAVSPQHSLLEDARVPDLYATVAQEAINLGDLDLAQQYLEVGMTHMPNDIDLINTRDRLTLARDRQQREIRIAELRQHFGEQTAGPANWQSFLEQRDAIVELSQLAPGDSALQALANMARPVIAAEFSSTTELSPDEHDLLLALRLDSQDLASNNDVVALEQRLQALLAAPELNHRWETEVHGTLQRIQVQQNATYPPVLQAKNQLADIYLEYINDLEQARRFSLAEAVLDRIDLFALNEPALDTARTRIQQEYNQFLLEREAAALQARILGMQSDLLVEAQAREIDAAESTLSQLRQHLDNNDPFLTITAADAMAEAYLELSEDLGRDGEYRAAVRMAERGLDISPNDLLLQNTREQFLVEANIGELNGLFQSSDHFDTPATQVMIDEVRTFAPARYPDLERQYTLMLVERVMALAESDRKQGESLATRASILFPGSAQLAQLRAELAPPPWVEGRTARVALSTGRLSEARNMLEASKARLPDHPEVLDFEKDLVARIAEAESQFALFQASLDEQAFEQARAQLAEARQMWTDNLDYRGAISTLSEQMAQQRWQGRILQRDVDIRTLMANSEMTGAEISAQTWTPVESTRPCSEDLAGYGRRARAICFDLLHDQVRGPLMVVIPGGEQNGFAISKYEISNEDYNKYCFLSGQCRVNDALDKDLPRTGLTIAQITEYTEWLSERTGQTYRLPMLEEWYYAANAEGQQPPRDYNCRVRLGGQVLKGDQINRVSTGHQNGWGLQNFIGNAQELVYQNGSLRAIGGSYQDPHAECGMEFTRAHSGTADSVTGFRLLLEDVQAPALQTVSNF
ncbi:MAG: protein kinase [Natronospirillum sp.]